MKVSKALSIAPINLSSWGVLVGAVLGTNHPSGSTSHHTHGLRVTIKILGKKLQIKEFLLVWTNRNSGQKTESRISSQIFFFSQKWLALSQCVWIPAKSFLRISSPKWCICTVIFPKGDISAGGTQRRRAGKFPWSVNENSGPGDDFCSRDGVIFPAFKHTSTGAGTVLVLPVKISSVN